MLFAFAMLGSAFGQGKVTVSGTVSVFKGQPAGAAVEVFQGGALINKFNADGKGQFSAIVDYDSDYELHIKGADKFTKIISLSTKGVPVDYQTAGNKYYGLEVEIYDKVDGVNASILSQPVGAIYYDVDSREFTYDRELSRQIAPQLQQLVDEIKVAQNKSDEDYKRAIKAGDKAMNGQVFVTAITEFKAALEAKKEDKYATDQLALAERNKQNQIKNEEGYNTAIAKGDAAFHDKKYDDAKTFYRTALGIKNEDYPKERLKLIEEKQAEKLAAVRDQLAKGRDAAMKDREYNALLKTANMHIENEQYQSAIKTYRKALEIKDEPFPKQKITEVEQKLDELAQADQERDKSISKKGAFRRNIESSDEDLSRQDLERAKQKLESAKAIDEQGVEAEKKLADVNELLDSEKKSEESRRKLATAATEQAKYEQTVIDGDRYFKNENWDMAKVLYNQATGLRSDSAYPKAQIERINEIIRKRAKGSELLEESAADKRIKLNYSFTIADADKALGELSFDAAEKKYRDALLIFPERPYPQKQLNRIEELRKEIASDDGAKREQLIKKYNTLITKADGEFEAKQYPEARSTYKEAGQIKAGGAYPFQQIEKIDNLIATAKAEEEAKAAREAKEAEYKKMVAAGDVSFKGEQYSIARLNYRWAQKIKPKEKYPEEQIAKISEIEAERQQKLLAELDKQNQFMQQLGEARELKEKGEYAEAIAIYKKASEMIPSSLLPKDAIDEIDKEVKVAAETKEAFDEAQQKRNAQKLEYDKTIQAADAKLLDKQYKAAEELYAKAIGIKNDENYPRVQLLSILQNRAEAKGNVYREKKAQREELERDSAFNSMIVKADGYYNQQEWIPARVHYRQALYINPISEYASERITQVQEKIEAENGREVKIEKIDPLAKEFPQGVTEQKWKDGGKTVIRRIVVTGVLANDYRQVTHNWGGVYYFKNDKPSTKFVWDKETIE